MSSTNGNRQETAILFLHAQTSLHPGSGTALGTVDLPVQRERHTQWPTIPASSLKGVLRDACRQRVVGKRGREADEDDEVTEIFGPPSQHADKHAGALSITDSRILAFPVRSLKGVFAWTTCPAVLERLNRDLALTGLRERIGKIPTPGRNQAACIPNCPLLIDNQSIVLEEFEFSATDGAAEVLKWYGNVVEDEATRNRLATHLVVLNDDDFTHFVRHATEVMARIGLEYDTKTVKTGALFYQEFLPPETLFYTLVFANGSRRNGNGRDARSIFDSLASKTPKVLQIGGDETTGKGLCTIHFKRAKE